jgi:hypothetical protein
MERCSVPRLNKYTHYTHTHSPAENPNPPPQLTKRPRTLRIGDDAPYTRIGFRKTTRPAAGYTPNVGLVQARCVAEEGDPAVVNLMRSIFASGISTKALTRRMTRDEAREYNCGAPGQMSHASLRTDEEKRFRCRLCVVGTDEGGWKQARHALRHLNRDHFGLGARDLLSPLISTLVLISYRREAHEQCTEW